MSEENIIAVADAPARCEAPAWAGGVKSVYIFSERIGLIGWCDQCTVLQTLDSEDTEPDLLHTDLLYLSPLANHELLLGNSYVTVFEGATFTLDYGERGKVAHPCPSVIWGTFTFPKTKEPTVRNLIVAERPVAPSEISKCLKRVRVASEGTK